MCVGWGRRVKRCGVQTLICCATTLQSPACARVATLVTHRHIQTAACCATTFANAILSRATFKRRYVFYTFAIARRRSFFALKGRASSAQANGLGTEGNAYPGRWPGLRESGPSALKKDHSFPSTRSTTQHPRTCVALASRQWLRMSSLSHPAS